MIRRFLAAFVLMLALPLAAHQQRSSISVISHNPRTSMLEVVHSIPLHDAEHALRSRDFESADVLGDIESRRAFARYVAERFSIADSSGEIELTLLGTEVEGASLLVYQEAPSPGSGAELLVNSQVLTDVWARQTNRVNLGIGTSVETLVFQAGSAAKSASLP